MAEHRPAGFDLGGTPRVEWGHPYLFEKVRVAPLSDPIGERQDLRRRNGTHKSRLSIRILRFLLLLYLTPLICISFSVFLLSLGSLPQLRVCIQYSAKR